MNNSMAEFALGLKLSEKLIERLDNAFQMTWGHHEEERDLRLDNAAVEDMQVFLTRYSDQHYRARCEQAVERALKRRDERDARRGMLR